MRQSNELEIPFILKSQFLQDPLRDKIVRQRPRGDFGKTQSSCVDAISDGSGLILVPSLFSVFPTAAPVTLFDTPKAATVCQDCLTGTNSLGGNDL
jgi:hypothetical protein